MNDSDTKTRILDAATELFLAQGYGKTNIEQVASSAGVTKPTVYSHFGSKQGLIEAMTARQSQTRIAELAGGLQASGDPEADLTQFAEVFLSRVMSKEARAWHRLATAESDRYPEVGAAFYNAGPRRVFGYLTRYLEDERDAGRLQIENAELAAEQFLGLLLGLDLLRSLVGQPLSSTSKRKQRCRSAVAMFLAAHRAGVSS